MRILALVTARGGSKGFPGKNVALLAGRPLVAWAHRALDGFRARHPEHEVILHLSTDSTEIAAAWPTTDRPKRLRPTELAQDGSTSMDVMAYELEQQAVAGLPCEALILLQPTSPLIDTNDVERTWAPIGAGRAPASIAVAHAPHPLAWARHRDGDDHLTPAVPEANTKQRQSQRTAWMPNGLYAARADFLLRHRTFDVAGETVGVELNPQHAVDIDFPQDLAIAETLLRRKHGERSFVLGSRIVGGNEPCFVIAEAGVNHNGDVEKAFALVRAAKDAGADAVKFQTFRAKELVGAAARKAAYQVANTGGGESQLAMLERLELGPQVFRDLKAEAERLGLVFLSTPFDRMSAQLLADLGVVGFKLGSGDLTNLPFLAELADFKRPMILSSGMATLDEVEDAVATLHQHGCHDVAMLHCVSSYPAPVDQTNLLAMDSIRLAVGGPVGMSDHSMGWEVTLAAVARGAKVIEKHLTLDRTLPGPDHAASIEPHEFQAMMRQVRLVESALGDGIKRPAPCERDTAEVARRSVVAVRDLPAGTRLTAADLAIKRPGTGIEPRHHATVAGRTLRRAIAADEPLRWEDLA
jgi:N-acetylneuraminate synthase